MLATVGLLSITCEFRWHVWGPLYQGLWENEWVSGWLWAQWAFQDLGWGRWGGLWGWLVWWRLLLWGPECPRTGDNLCHKTRGHGYHLGFCDNWLETQTLPMRYFLCSLGSTWLFRWLLSCFCSSDDQWRLWFLLRACGIAMAECFTTGLLWWISFFFFFWGFFLN